MAGRPLARPVTGIGSSPFPRYEGIDTAKDGPPIPAWRKVALNLDEAAAMIGVSRSHLEKYVASEELTVVRIGKSVRVMPETLKQFVLDREGAAE